MFMLDLLNKIVKIAEKKGASQVEVFAASSTRKSANIEKNEPKYSVLSREQGVNIRVIYGGGIGSAYTLRLDEKSIEKTIEKAISIAKVRGKDPYFKSFASPQKYPEVEGLFSKNTAEVTVDDMLKDLIEVRDMYIKYDPRLSSLDFYSSVSVRETYIVNSLGVEAYGRSTSAYFAAEAICEEKGIMFSSYDYQVERDYKKINMSKVAKNAVEFALRQARGVKAETEKLPVVLDPLAIGSLFFILFYAISANNVQEKRSFLAGKIGEKVFDEKLTIIDDPLLPEGNASRKFDGEGVASRKLALIENGVLKTYLYNLYTAQREGRESTGHASRGLRGEPGISPSNIIVQLAEEKKLEELLAEVTKGIYVRTVIGAHTANTVTGDFSVALGEAYLIEKSELGPAVKQAMVSGNFAEVFSNIIAASKEKIKKGSLLTGHLLVELMISG